MIRLRSILVCLLFPLVIVAAGFAGYSSAGSTKTHSSTQPNYKTVAHTAIDLYVALTARNYPVADLQYLRQRHNRVIFSATYSDGNTQSFRVRFNAQGIVTEIQPVTKEVPR